MSDLQGRDLDRAIADIAGYWWMEEGDGLIGARDGEDACYPLNFHLSLDALRDGPERLLREAGWSLWIGYDARGMNVQWIAMDGSGRETAIFRCSPEQEAESRARAVLAALRAMKEGGE